jgi:hypothetical protein
MSGTIQIDPTRAYKNKTFSPKNRSNRKYCGKARKDRFWMFSASLRMIPASNCPQKI